MIWRASENLSEFQNHAPSHDVDQAKALQFAAGYLSDTPFKRIIEWSFLTLGWVCAIYKQAFGSRDRVKDLCRDSNKGGGLMPPTLRVIAECQIWKLPSCYSSRDA